MSIGATMRLKYLAKINQSALSESTDPDREIRYLDISGVGRGALAAEPEAMTFATAPSRARRLVRDGDTIVSTVRTYLRAVLPIRSPDPTLVVSTGFAVLTPTASVDPEYFSWAVQSDPFIEEIVARSVGVSYPGINASDIGDIRVPVAEQTQQRAIADYLDRETARIDAVITKKQRMIELLQLRTESLIAANLDPAITRWGEAPLKSVAKLAVSNVDKKSYDEQMPVKLCNYTDVYYNRRITNQLDFMSATADAKQVQRLTLHAGDVLITKDSETADDIAVPALVQEDLPGVVLGYHLALIRPTSVNGDFLYWAIRSRRSRDAFSLAASGVTRVGLRQDAMGRVPIPAVPSAMQSDLTEAIERDVGLGEDAVRKLSAQANLLRERRQALITSAVTGELEVPGVAA